VDAFPFLGDNDPSFRGEPLLSEIPGPFELVLSPLPTEANIPPPSFWVVVTLFFSPESQTKLFWFRPDLPPSPLSMKTPREDKDPPPSGPVPPSLPSPSSVNPYSFTLKKRPLFATILGKIPGKLLSLPFPYCFLEKPLLFCLRKLSRAKGYIGSSFPFPFLPLFFVDYFTFSLQERSSFLLLERCPSPDSIVLPFPLLLRFEDLETPPGSVALSPFSNSRSAMRVCLNTPLPSF